MQTYIVFLRGINVGGHNKIPMQDLRLLLSQLKLESVKTYIQTGNIIVKSTEIDRKKIASKIKEAIYKTFGFYISTLIKTPKQISLILDKCPFNEEEKLNSYFALLFDEVSQQLEEHIKTYSFPNETFLLVKDCIYLYSSVGYGRSKANNNFFEKELKVTATTRNYKTLKKLIELSES